MIASPALDGEGGLSEHIAMPLQADADERGST